MNGCETNISNNPLHCGRCGSVCPGYLCTSGTCGHARNCGELHASRPDLPSGIYPIDPDGPGGDAPFNILCEMALLGGGWTLVQRTVWDWEDNRQLVTNYADYYANTYGSPLPGRTFRMAGRYWPALQGSSPMHLLAFTPRRTDNLDCSPMYYTVTGGAWTVHPVSGARLSAFTERAYVFMSPVWVTTDFGTPTSTSCVTRQGAVPWTHENCCNTCPTYGGTVFSPPRPIVAYLHSIPDEFGNLVATRCAGGTPLQIRMIFTAVSIMEYFTR
jgi:hypothetical protein